ncbi:MAG: hypothetical protein V4543_00665 [Bacteroidota bacterium]
MNKPGPTIVFTIASIAGGIAGSYAAYLRAKSNPDISFWESQAWKVGGSITANIIALCLVNPKPLKKWK